MLYHKWYLKSIYESLPKSGNFIRKAQITVVCVYAYLLEIQEGILVLFQNTATYWTPIYKLMGYFSCLKLNISGHSLVSVENRGGL